jgi:uncharacterized protein (DUF885 family)
MAKLRIMNLATAYNRFMTRFSHAVWFGLALFGLTACGGGRAPAASPAAAAAAAAPHENLAGIVERYWDERATPGSPLTPQFMADSLAVERRFLAEVLAVPRAGLDADARLTYDIFKRQREVEIEGFTYPAELMPVNPFDGMPWQFARAAAALGQNSRGGAKDYENWLGQIDGYVGWTRQAIANMREGMRRGYTSPRVLMERVLPLLQELGADTSANVFYQASHSMPQTIKEPERTRLSSSLDAAVRDKLLPAYRELHDFIQGEYLPRARTSVALSVLPLGPSWYAYRIERATDSRLTANEVHAIGVAEVERIRARLVSLPAGVPPAGAAANAGIGTAADRGVAGGAGASTGESPVASADAAADAGSGRLLIAYQELKTQTLAAIPNLFSAVPKSDFEIRAAGPASAPTPHLDYQSAAPDGRIPAVLYVNGASGAGRPAPLDIAGFLQEAIPGRHFQAAIQRERADLPEFRRFGSDPAFVDGWALYAASLGEELGLYRDDEAKRAALRAQLGCAAALVADTGLHALDWTRARAADYLRQQLGIDAADADLRVDRFVALPGDALACTLGELKIQALRSRAQQVLGARFDIREFHTEILKDGAMPLDILEAKMKLWLDARR